uniref:Uncharacterized protein n=1 Tax=Knipowitschia caucasica TaxID=637954 RepID=A0AAV2JDN9_KNICA
MICTPPTLLISPAGDGKDSPAACSLSLQQSPGMSWGKRTCSRARSLSWMMHISPKNSQTEVKDARNQPPVSKWRQGRD